MFLFVALIHLFTNSFSKGFADHGSRPESVLPKMHVAFARMAAAGPYNSAFGVTYGLNPGVTFKHFVDDETAYEISVGTRWKGFSLTGILEASVSIGDIGPGLMWNFGIGPRLGFYNGKDYRDYLGANKEARTYILGGVVGTFGFEYYFAKIPITVGAEYRPFFDFKRDDDSFLDGALFLRYVF